MTIVQKSCEFLDLFMLDEVFGSLNTDRRSNALMALERLTRPFGQIFVISQVDEGQ